MKTIILIALGIIAILSISGCTNPLCQPDWISTSPALAMKYQSSIFGLSAPVACKVICYNEYDTSSYRYSSNQCQCDLNDCGIE